MLYFYFIDNYITMSEKAPVPAEELKTATVEETTKNEETKTKEEAPKTEQPDIAKQQTARAIKAEEEAKALKERLASYEAKDEEEERAKKEAEWKYRELIEETQSKAEARKAEQELKDAELERLRAENTAFITDMEAKALAQIPEDKRETVTSIVSAYTGKEKIDKITELVTAFGGTVSFGGTPNVKKSKPGSRIDDLVAKRQAFLSDPKKNPRLSYQETEDLRKAWKL